MFQNTVLSKGHYYRSIKSSGEDQGPGYIQAVLAFLPPYLPHFLPSAFLSSFLNFYFPSSFSSFQSVIFTLPSLEPVARRGEYIVVFTINLSTRHFHVGKMSLCSGRELWRMTKRGAAVFTDHPNAVWVSTLWPLPIYFAITHRSAKHELKTKRSELLPRWAKRMLEDGDDPLWNNHDDKISTLRVSLAFVFVPCFPPLSTDTCWRLKSLITLCFPEWVHSPEEKAAKFKAAGTVLAIWGFHKCISPFNVANFQLDFLFFPFSFFLSQKEIHKDIYLVHELTLSQDCESPQITQIIHQVA